MHLLRDESTYGHGVHHPVLVVPNENGGCAFSRQPIKVVEARNGVIPGNARPYKHPCQSVVQVGRLYGGVEDGTLFHEGC